MGTDHDCFCELAPLYALGLLTEEEHRWIEQQVRECPDLAEELVAHEAAVTAIPYGVSLPPIAPDLKHRLFDHLGLESPPAAMLAPSWRPPSLFPSLPSVVVRSQDLNWQSHPVPGVTIAIVHTDEGRREIAGFLRAAPGARYPFHRHAAIEEILMLEGDLVIDDQIYGPGDYIRSQPGSGHAPHSQNGCRFFFRTSMDDEYPDFRALSFST